MEYGINEQIFGLWGVIFDFVQASVFFYLSDFHPLLKEKRVYFL